jgi:CRP/FNR family cyclic AMP-dependent transcriptional regulator
MSSVIISASPTAHRLPRTMHLSSASFDRQLFLDAHGLGRMVAQFREKETVFAQGGPATSVMFIREGGVKLAVVNETGKEAVVGILGKGDFLGEGCLAGRSVCAATATAIAPTTVLVIGKNEMIRLLHKEKQFFSLFITYILARNIRVEEDLIDHLFNSSEKRLARTLLLLARGGSRPQTGRVLSKLTQKTLAEMIGTTRSRVNFFMNKFRRLGFIHYDHGIHINDSLLRVVLQDE